METTSIVNRNLCLHQFFFVTAVSWGFVCLMTSFEDCLWDSVSWAFDDFVYMRVCLRVWHVCNSWCLCNGGRDGGVGVGTRWLR